MDTHTTRMQRDGGTLDAPRPGSKGCQCAECLGTRKTLIRFAPPERPLVVPPPTGGDLLFILVSTTVLSLATHALCWIYLSFAVH